MSGQVNALFRGKRLYSHTRLEIKVRVACGPCNNGWMSDLEAAFKALMMDAITGEAALPDRRISLSSGSQQVVATWVIKTWLLLEMATEHARSGAIKSPDTLRFIYRNRMPPNQLHTWIGAYIPPPNEAHSFRSAAVSLGDGPVVGVLVLLTFGRLLFLVFAPISATGTLSLAGVLPDALLQIWPGKVAEVRWPPSAILNAESLLTLVPENGVMRL